MKPSEPIQFTIGNKKVYGSEPFLPRLQTLTDFEGKGKELALITASWIAGDHTLPMNPLLVGEPGVGKNRIVYELAQKTGRQLYIFQGHEDVTSEDIACTVRFSDRDNSVMDYVFSPLVTAMFTGGICLADEIGKIRPRALSLLASVLDDRRYIDSILLGERIHAHPAFRFVAATNTNDINLLPDFILSRLRPQIKMGYPTKEEIDSIIRNHCRGLKQETDRLIDNFWFLWIDYHGSATGISPRDVIYLFGWASKLSAFESSGGYDTLKNAQYNHLYQLPAEHSFTGIKPEQLEKAFRELFTDGLLKSK